MARTITVTVAWTVDGFHRWPEAAGERAYLADRHRHRFHCTATIPVDHDDRQVEFHDLLDACHDLYAHGQDFGRASCETIATEIAAFVAEAFPVPWVTASVAEDGYVTATVHQTNED